MKIPQVVEVKIC